MAVSTAYAEVETKPEAVTAVTAAETSFEYPTVPSNPNAVTEVAFTSTTLE